MRCRFLPFLFFLLCSCGPDPNEKLTGIELTVVYTVDLDQFALSGSTDESTFERTLVPQTPEAFPQGRETIVILFDEHYAGSLISLDIDGLYQGTVSAQGRGEVELQARQLVPLEVALVCVGDACGECNETTCSHGCCDVNGCHLPDAEHCGTGGAPCRICDSRWADGCSNSGECLCGTDPACEGGQLCLGGLCVCNAESCPSGCCEGNICRTRSFEYCGVGGATCLECDPLLASTCTAEGECKCGTEDICELGQNCLSGTCICDELSCETGCCNDNRCFLPTVDACGVGGAICTRCDDVRSDGCGSEGTCQCGGGPPVEIGQRCEGGSATCDIDSCAAGCCLDGRCELISFASCGNPGEACTACDIDRADRCTEGQCRCGSGGICAEGQRCQAGICICDEFSCDGCCSSDVCHDGTAPDACGSGGTPCFDCPGDDTCESGICSSCACATGCCTETGCDVSLSHPESCGADGTPCTPCDLERSDRCSDIDGTCACGPGSTEACDLGQRCEDGDCICDPHSCTTGCCEDDECIEPSFEACSSGGNACVPCDADIADNCSPSGECRCGTGPVCGDGQRCEGGVCVCNRTSCPDGCCSGNVCESRSLATCGTDGNLCVTCNSERADTCSVSGECLCGSSAACDVGQRCSSGSCVCDTTSCGGCCDGDNCVEGTEDSLCGTGGIDCIDCPSPDTCDGGACSGCNASNCSDGCCSGDSCESPSVEACGLFGLPCVTCNPDRADRCTDGQCQCGTGDPCDAGQICSGGSCVCNATSCADGCCDGNTCHSRSDTTCGTGGEACTDCIAAGGDSCSPEGECRCGWSGLCDTGQRCSGGSCICDGESCTGCCDGSDCFPGTAVRICGIDGNACQKCHPHGDCIDGVCYR